MPATSPEAKARKAEKRNQKRRAESDQIRIRLQKSDWPRYKIAARKMRGKLPQMTKQQLRDMITQAVRNTAEASNV